MQLPPEVVDLQQRLNSPSVVDVKWYRRNHGAYELISYINNLGGVLASGNLETVPVFIERIKTFLLEGGNQYISAEFAALVQEYLKAISKVLATINTPNNSFKADA